MSALPKVIKRGHLAVLRAIFTVRLLDDGNNRYQADGAGTDVGREAMLGLVMMMRIWHKV